MWNWHIWLPQSLVVFFCSVPFQGYLEHSKITTYKLSNRCYGSVCRTKKVKRYKCINLLVTWFYKWFCIRSGIVISLPILRKLRKWTTTSLVEKYRSHGWHSLQPSHEAPTPHPDTHHTEWRTKEELLDWKSLLEKKKRGGGGGGGRWGENNTLQTHQTDTAILKYATVKPTATSSQWCWLTAAIL